MFYQHLSQQFSFFKFRNTIYVPSKNICYLLSHKKKMLLKILILKINVIIYPCCIANYYRLNDSKQYLSGYKSVGQKLRHNERNYISPLGFARLKPMFRSGCVLTRSSEYSWKQVIVGLKSPFPCSLSTAGHSQFYKSHLHSLAHGISIFKSSNRKFSLGFKSSVPGRALSIVKGSQNLVRPTNWSYI